MSRSNISRRRLLQSSAAATVLGAVTSKRSADAADAPKAPEGSRLVVPNGRVLPYTMKDGVKEFHLVAQEIEQEFSPGMTVKCWGYNGSTPGPVIEAYEGDRVRILVTNELPEHTSIHWHGIYLPNGMDGATGLTQPPIGRGKTWVYEFTLRQHGTYMYHPHADEMVQMALGMMGMFVIHPKREARPVDRDFCVMLHEWAVHPGTARPDPMVMLDFNTFTFNGKVFPSTESLVTKTGDRVRLRLGNLSMNQHPIHLHGVTFEVTGTDGGPIPKTARWPAATVGVPVGTTRDIEWVHDDPGDWVLHCHKSHHTMNAMGHELPNMIGVDTSSVDQRLRTMLPGYMPMGQRGMGDMQDHARHMKGPENTLPMMGGEGPFGNVEMGGMFTLVKVREELETYDRDPGWYDHPEGTVAHELDGEPPTPNMPNESSHDHHHHDGHEGVGDE